MEIDRIIFPVNTLGMGKRVCIWTIGCERRCFNCSNPELQRRNKSKNIEISEIIKVLKPYKNNIEGITLTGGDPFFQQDELCTLVERVYEEITKDIILFTGYALEELKENSDEKIERILNKISILIDGEYIEELNDNKGLRGSSNQKIHILKDKYYESYKEAFKWERKVQNIFYENNSIHVGIPLKCKNNLEK